MIQNKVIIVNGSAQIFQVYFIVKIVMDLVNMSVETVTVRVELSVVNVVEKEQ
jgi:hypothetical protein